MPRPMRTSTQSSEASSIENTSFPAGSSLGILTSFLPSARARAGVGLSRRGSMELKVFLSRISLNNSMALALCLVSGEKIPFQAVFILPVWSWMASTRIMFSRTISFFWNKCSMVRSRIFFWGSWRKFSPMAR